MFGLYCCVEKYDKTSIASIERHRLGADYSSGTGALAIGLLPRDGELRQSVFERIAQQSNSKRTVRKDTTILCEIKITITNLFLKSLPESDFLRFFEVMSAFLQKEYREENHIYAVVHSDENTSHLHYGFVPMTEDGRLSASRMVNRTGLQRLHTELPERLLACGFSVENGEDVRTAHSVAEENAMEQLLRELSGTSFLSEPVQQKQFSGAGMSSLNRENQSLKLKILLLERNLKGVVDIIKSDRRLELLYLSQMEKISLQKRELHEYLISNVSEYDFSDTSVSS